MTQLSKRVHRKTSTSNAVRKASLLFAFAAFSVCIGLYSAHRGFDLGLIIGEGEKEAVLIVDGTEFSADGIRINGYLAARYFCTAWFIAMFLIIALTHDTLANEFPKSKIILEGTSFVPLMLAVHQVWWIFSEKALATSSIVWSEPTSILARKFVPVDWSILVVVLGVALTQAAVSIINRGAGRRGHL